MQLAVNCCGVLPATSDADPGATVMLVRVALAAATVNGSLPVMLPDVALIVVLPAATPVATPAAEIVAVPVLLLDQVTVDVQMELLPSE